ncbi:BglG family transcription antiterminator LicT [Vagococcus entomophilus]|uniref:Transcription antiterminator BglG n=1 Tax=Vagococcus entomophilus TaxID=1160095 RepID=A0A430AII9_9ENTE|nr:PRD domain-containing protein [Vagococcus entomophilus]RSU07727.1 transcription antiterminator BglG [Vagococcus entomophilus]
MKIVKIYNNNVVLSENDRYEEIVVMGKGLAFQKKIGMKLDSERVEKIFVLNDQSAPKNKWVELFSNIPEKELQVMQQVLFFIEHQLEESFEDSTYFAFIDHLHYALERYRQQMLISNPLIFEIRKFYAREFEIAKDALEIIKDELGIELPEDEAGFITFHIVNAVQKNQGMAITMEITRLVKAVLSIISKFYGIVFDESSLNYQRIVTHIYYFFQRVLTDEAKVEQDDFLYEVMQTKYLKAFECALRIKTYVENEKNTIVSESEIVYLTLHIQRVTQEISK